MDTKTYIDEIYSAFESSVLTSVNGAAPKVKEAASEFLVNEKDALKNLGITFLSGEIDADFLKRRLEEVKEDLINALIAIEQIIASEITNLADSIISIFKGLLSAALSSIKAI